MYIESFRQPEQLIQMMQLQLGAGDEAADGRSRKYPAGSFGHDCGFGSENEAIPQSVLRWMAGQLLSIQENERRRIAADLHDGLGQSLSMLKMALAEAEQLFASGAINEAAVCLQRLRLRAHNALDEMRSAAMDLRPPMLDDLGLLPTLSWFFRELESVSPGLRVEKDFSVHESAIPAGIKITIFRIVQEASNNIIKYANADLIRVRLEKSGDALRFSIEDNGSGFDFDEVVARGGSDHGLGLLSMKERALLSGGECVMDSSAGCGTRISIEWKCEQIGH